MIWSDEGPRVSCAMVTANRAALARRAIACFALQTWGNRELVIVDDGAEDYTPLLADLPADRVIYHRLRRAPDATLGRLRNLSLSLARGEVVTQWDDDDWFHPERIRRQMSALANGADACLLRETILHLDAPEWRNRPFVSGLKPGVPGTILHRADARLRYPETRRAEDTAFLSQFARDKLAVIDAPELVVYPFHGGNTWELAHFTRRLRNTPRDALEYAFRRFVQRDISRHRRFRLTTGQREAFARYVADSRAAGLMA